MGETAKESNAGAKKSCDDVTKVKNPVLAENSGYMKSFILRITRIWPLKHVFKMLKKIAVFTGLLEEVENVGSAEQIPSNKRRFVSGKKRIGRVARLILLITPYRIQYALGYRAGESIGKSSTDDIRKSPLKPCGKGSKRKQDDLDMEEQHSWVALMKEDLPDEDQDDDPTYEPSDSELDSEENKSKNDTESDLEVEEKNGVVMLKETTPEDTQGNEEQPNEDTQGNEEQPNEDTQGNEEQPNEDTQGNEEQPNEDTQGNEEQPNEDTQGNEEQPNEDTQGNEEQPNEDTQGNEEQPNESDNKEPSPDGGEQEDSAQTDSPLQPTH